MIEFTVSFLVGFVFSTFEIETNKKVEKTKNKSKKGKKKVSIVSTKASVAKAEEQKDPNIIECGSNKQTCHIEYVLLPFDSFPVYHVDIVCWDRVTKIFTKEDVCCIKSYIHKNITWVSFTVLHKLCSLTYRTIDELFNFEASFKFSQSPNELMSHVKNDAPKEFFDKPEENSDNSKSKTFFKPVLQISPVIHDTLQEIQDKEDDYYSSFPEKGKMFSLLNTGPNDLHKKRIMEKITTFKSTLQTSEKDRNTSLKPIEEKGSKKRKSTPKSKQKTPVTSEKNVYILNLRGTCYFEEGKILTSEMEFISPSIAYSGTFVTVNHILNYSQRKVLNPFTLHIRQLSNVPQDIIDKYRIQQVYCEYALDNMLTETQTPRTQLITRKETDLNYSHVCFFYPVTEQITFDHLGSAFLKDQALQTGRLVVKVYGVTSIQMNNDHLVTNVFGQEILDPNISSRHHEYFSRQKDTNSSFQNQTILLGTAVYNLFPLSEGEKYIEDIAILTSLPVPFEDTTIENGGLTMDKVNCIGLHLENSCDDTPKGDIPESVLLENFTTLQIQIKLALHLEHLPLYNLLKLPSIFGRLIVVFRNRKAASKVIQRILTLNSNILDSQAAVYPLVISENEKQKNYKLWKGQSGDMISLLDYETRKVSLSNSLSQSFCGSETWRTSVKAAKKGSDLITGFFIDDFTECILVIEGLANLTFPRIFSYVYTLPENVGRVIYNSDVIFSQRLYSEMSIFGGLYMATLGQPLDSLLSTCHLSLEGNVPTPAQKALFKLDLLRRTFTMHSASKMQLFPTSQQLFSFGMEFGVPFYMRSNMFFKF